MASDPMYPNIPSGPVTPPDLTSGSAADSLRALLGYSANRTAAADSQATDMFAGRGLAGGAYGNAIANQNTSVGLTPQALSALRTQGTSGINDQYASAAAALNSQLLRRGAAGQSGIPMSGGDYSRAFQPLYSAMEAAKTKSQTDTILADEAAKQKSLFQNQQLALQAAGGLNSGATSLFNAGSGALGQAGGIAQGLGQLEGPNIWKLLGTQALTSLLTGTGAGSAAVDGIKKLLGLGTPDISPTTGADAVLNGNNPDTSIPSGQAASLPGDAPVLSSLPANLGDILSGATPPTNANGILGAVPGTSTVSPGLPQLNPTLPEGFGAPGGAAPDAALLTSPAPAGSLTSTAEAAGAAAAPAALGIGGGAAAAAGLAPIEAPAAALLGDIGGAVAGAGTSMLGGGVGAGLLGAVPGTSTASAGLAALAPTLPADFGAPATTAGAEAASTGALGHALLALAENPVTWAAAAIIGGAIIWHKSQSHQTADTWVNNYQNKFDQDMASVSDQFAQLKEQGAVTPEVAQQFRDSAQQLIDAYQTNLSKFYSKGKKEAKVATQAQNTAVQYYGPMYENFLGNFTA